MVDFNQSMSMSKNSSSIDISSLHISPAACIGSAALILATVLGNGLVLAALLLDKRLHSPSFLLIANMAVADLLLGFSVLPFSSILEILDDRWIFGQRFCSAWLALDVVCCTASIIGLMAVSIDRYIGVTRPLKYTRIMTNRRTLYLIILVWTVSILTSVVPLFGLTDRVTTKSKGPMNLNPNYETCFINKNTFYTIFSSSVSFYIPVVILLILYSRVYQEAKRQGEKLENEKRRLYQIDYQIAAEQVRQQELAQSNGHLEHLSTDGCNVTDNANADNGIGHLTSTNDQLPMTTNGKGLRKTQSQLRIPNCEDISRSILSLNTISKTDGQRSWTAKLFKTIRRSSTSQTISSPHSHHNHTFNAKDELLVIKRKLHNLRREKKAFQTLVLILGALLICWLPFFVTLPVVSILKSLRIIADGDTESTWFKITFWLGYCNSALNPFVYAFSNRAIRRGLRDLIFRRCCWLCERKTSPRGRLRSRMNSGSLTTETSQAPCLRISSPSAERSSSRKKTIQESDKLLQANNQENLSVSLPVKHMVQKTSTNENQSVNEKSLQNHSHQN